MNVQVRVYLNLFTGLAPHPTPFAPRLPSDQRSSVIQEAQGIAATITRQPVFVWREALDTGHLVSDGLHRLCRGIPAEITANDFDQRTPRVLERCGGKRRKGFAPTLCASHGVLLIAQDVFCANEFLESLQAFLRTQHRMAVVPFVDNFNRVARVDVGSAQVAFH